MRKSILLPFVFALLVGASAGAHALSFGGALGGSGAGSSCADTTMTGCWCKCMTFGDEMANCNVAAFIDPHGNVCAYCYGDSCATDLSGFGGWSFIP